MSAPSCKLPSCETSIHKMDLQSQTVTLSFASLAMMLGLVSISVSACWSCSRFATQHSFSSSFLFLLFFLSLSLLILLGMACSRIHAIVHKPAFRAGSAGNCQPSYLDKLLQPFALFKSIDCLGRVMDALPKYVPEAAIRSLMDGRDMSLQCIDAAVFFLDVENFTGQLAARRSSHPDSLALLHQMSQAFDVFSQQVVAHGGVLDKVVGDSIVCWFPSDAASESHNVRACRAALGCLDAVTRLHETWSRDGYALLQFRIGIASGPCYCGSFGAPQHRVHWTVMSDVVNTASRLESLAKQFRARVVVSKEIVDDVRAACMSDPRVDALGRVQFELLGKEVLRGRSTETDVYSLTAVPQSVVDEDSCSVSQSSA